MIHETILAALYLFLPAYFGNMFPVFAAVIFRRRFSTPVDFGKTYKGKRITGDHKTWRGLLAGGIGGLLAFYLQKEIMQNYTIWTSVALIEYQSMTAFFGFSVGLGAVIGDLAKSVLKRRMGIASGQDWFFFDQMDYVVGGLVALLFFVTPSIKILLTIIIGSFILHLVVSYLSTPLKNLGNKKT